MVINPEAFIWKIAFNTLKICKHGYRNSEMSAMVSQILSILKFGIMVSMRLPISFTMSVQ